MHLRHIAAIKFEKIRETSFCKDKREATTVATFASAAVPAVYTADPIVVPTFLHRAPQIY
jgi:hypothetical protein